MDGVGRKLHFVGANSLQAPRNSADNWPMWRTQAVQRIGASLGVAVLSISAASSARADADDYVFTTYTAEGARFIQYAGGVARNRDGSSSEAQSVLLGFNPTARWFTAAYGGWYRDPGDALQFGAVSWLNHVALLEPGTSPFELGFYVKVERPQDRSQGYEITWGPTLQADLGFYQFNANLLAAKRRSYRGTPVPPGWYTSGRSSVSCGLTSAWAWTGLERSAPGETGIPPTSRSTWWGPPSSRSGRRDRTGKCSRSAWLRLPA